ncbi:MAG: HAD family hydrolase [Spirochaetia bacterium]|jgi:phosphoglycolate phosphatase-like HAD superfamily hydrolase|nr:HAD family hydrolase [Spirochaetia bacterium]
MIKNKLVIFDYDGVIADSLRLWINAFEAAGVANSISFRLSRKEISRLEHITFPSILSHAGLDKHESVSKYVKDITDIFDSNTNSVSFFPVVARLIENLYLAGNTICINTANNSSIVEKRLKAEGVLSFISEIAGGDHEGSKSDKILAFMEKFGFDKKDTFMIGDSLGDITEGKKAGVITVASGYGWQEEEKLLSGEPDFLCSTPQELESLFANDASDLICQPVNR